MDPSSPLVVAILGALLGAVAAGSVQALLARNERQKEIEAIRAALVMEVVEICRLIRFRRYVEYTAELVAELSADPQKSGAMVADLREDYFSVFHALAPKLGKLAASEAAKIVQFYMLCKASKDSIVPDGVMADNEDHEPALENAEQLLKLMSEALVVGDHIAQWGPR